mgnify:CR=1 FL=1
MVSPGAHRPDDWQRGHDMGRRSKNKGESPMASKKKGNERMNVARPHRPTPLIPLTQWNARGGAHGHQKLYHRRHHHQHRRSSLSSYHLGIWSLAKSHEGAYSKSCKRMRRWSTKGGGSRRGSAVDVCSSTGASLHVSSQVQRFFFSTGSSRQSLLPHENERTDIERLLLRRDGRHLPRPGPSGERPRVAGCL